MALNKDEKKHANEPGYVWNKETKRWNKKKVAKKAKTSSPKKSPVRRARKCGSGKIRWPVTGKCVKPCPEGTFRSPITHKCKKTKACPEDKIRDPLTGRCKKLTAKQREFVAAQVKARVGAFRTAFGGSFKL